LLDEAEVTLQSIENQVKPCWHRCVGHDTWAIYVSLMDSKKMLNGWADRLTAKAQRHLSRFFAGGGQVHQETSERLSDWALCAVCDRRRRAAIYIAHGLAIRQSLDAEGLSSLHGFFIQREFPDWDFATYISDLDAAERRLRSHALKLPHAEAAER